ncbi:hypothetical protein F4810DRAFT_337625 [Camillea tinctor]|nr:hypothetical protein F4810DRAFT_337625 [Camillea tinctor]
MPRQFKKESCNTCRNRKVKCDEGYPICERCTKAERYCDRSERPVQIVINPGYKPKDRELSTKSPRQALEARETADLFHHYISNLAPWYDLSDERFTFMNEVPITARDDPLLFSALMALSAMHKSKTTTPSLRDAAESYHSQCIRLLIDLDPNDPRIEKGVALAATCLLRSYEILDGEDDPNRHLRGAYSLASRYHNLPCRLSGGLLASGYWNYLREDITFSLFGRCRLKMDMGSHPGCTPYSSDHAYLNEISLVLGRIMNQMLDMTSGSNEMDWFMLFAFIEVIFKWLPVQFKPYFRVSASHLSALPSMRMLQDCHGIVPRLQKTSPPC